MKPMDQMSPGRIASRLVVKETIRLAARVTVILEERNALRYDRKMFRRRIEKDLVSMLELRKTWKPGNPQNPYHAVAVALNALLEDANA